MNSLVDKLNEINLRSSGLRRKRWYIDVYKDTKDEWVDLFEINGSGVVDYLNLSCDVASSNCRFRVSFDDVVWECGDSSMSRHQIFSGDSLFGAYGTDLKGLVVPNYVGNSLDVININTVRLISTDSTGDELLYNNILPGGIKFNKQFKVSVKTYGSYRLMPCALYGIY